MARWENFTFYLFIECLVPLLICGLADLLAGYLADVCKSEGCCGSPFRLYIQVCGFPSLTYLKWTNEKLECLWTRGVPRLWIFTWRNCF